MNAAETGSRTTIGATVQGEETRRFVGRQAELSLLREILAGCHQRPAILYVQGSVGVGKSALLRVYRHLAAEMNVPAVLLDATQVEPTQGALQAALADNHCFPDRGPFLLLIDAYEELLPLDRWLRSEVFGRLGLDACLVLAGRSRAASLWRLAPAWRSLVREISLKNLSAVEADALLQRQGVTAASVRREAVTIAGGTPLLLLLAAEALTHPPEGDGASAALLASAETGGPAVASFLLEQLTHPGSRRRLWRIGTSRAPLDVLLAAAALLRTFDQDLLAAVVGRGPVLQGWARLLELPVVREVDGWYAVHDAVGELVTDLLQNQCPWLARHWCHAAIRHHLDRVGSQAAAGDRTWVEVSHLATDTLWHSWLHPPGEARSGWRFERGARPEDLPDLERCLEAAMVHWGFGTRGVFWVTEFLHRLLRECPYGFILARDTRGHLIGFHAHVPLRRETRELLLGSPSLGLYLRSLPEATVNAWEGRTLCACFVAMADPGSGLHRALLREFCREFHRYERVIGMAPEGWPGTPEGQISKIMSLLGMEPVPGLRWSFPRWSITLQALHLDLTASGYTGWLHRLTGLTAGPDLSLSNPPGAAKDALEAFWEGERLLESAAARRFAVLFGPPSVEAMRSWLLDALEEGCPWAGLLRRYYVERAGTHEALAEAANLPRRTYFNHLHRALEDLAHFIFT